MDGVKVVLGNRKTTLEGAQQWGIDRKNWKALVIMQMIEFQAAIFAWFLCSLGPSSRALVAYHPETGGLPLHNAVW